MVSKYKLASDWDGQNIQTRYVAQPASPPPIIETLSSQRAKQEKENFKNASSKLRNIALIAFITGVGLIIFNNSSTKKNTVENPIAITHEVSSAPVNKEVEVAHKEAEKAVHKTQIASESIHHSKKNTPNFPEGITNNEEKDSNPIVKNNERTAISEDKEIYQTMDQLKSLTK